MNEALVTRMLSALQSPDAQNELRVIRGEIAAQLIADPHPVRRMAAQLLINGEERRKTDTNRRTEIKKRRAGVLRRLKSDLQILGERNAAFAAAVGACAICWGDDAACPSCHGNGQPGHRLPNRALFKQLIAPAVFAVRQRGAQRHSGDEGSVAASLASDMKDHAIIQEKPL